jgi:hypothetical protein
MRDRIVKRTGAELERYVERHVKAVFEARRGSPSKSLEVPWIGGQYNPRDKRENYADLMQQACKAVAAQWWFESNAPKWAWPLPLRFEDFDFLDQDPDGKQQILGLYARSLRLLDWAYQIHPPLNAFGSGVMAYRFTPAELRADRELQRIFPPKGLEGLNWGRYWSRPGT